MEHGFCCSPSKLPGVWDICGTSPTWGLKEARNLRISQSLSETPENPWEPKMLVRALYR